jgi:hypothetical protein
MQISPGQNQGTPVELPGAPVNQVRIERAAAPPALVEKTPASADISATQSLSRLTDVSLRRDTNGRVYYVVSDAQSGQEIIEVPPKALRDISQGIEDFLKEQQSKVSAHVQIKA